MLNKDIETLRAQVAELDSEIIDLLIKRFELTDKIGEIKKQKGVPVENKELERQILGRLSTRTDGKFDSELVFNIYSEIFRESKKRQKRI
jgi:chorismate mutase